MPRPDEAKDSNVGRVIAGKYRLVTVLGAGGAGTVYRAVQIGLERDVALKILNPQLISNQTAQARFRREARAASRLEHPNSVRVYDYGVEPDGTTYLTMELVEGRELFKVIYEDWPHSTERIVNVMGQVLSVLGTAHDLGIVHRDLKPENILLLARKTESGHETETVKVTDFGIAKTFAEMGEESMKLTQAGTVHGTPEYMAPEQARGDEVDGRADLYSCGVILYEMMTGSLPFTSDNVFEVIMQQISRPVEPPTRRRASADRRLEPVVMRALSKEREDRFRSAREMRDALFDAAAQAPFAEGVPTEEDPIPLDSRAFAPTMVAHSGSMEPIVPLAKRRLSRSMATANSEAFAQQQQQQLVVVADSSPVIDASAPRPISNAPLPLVSPASHDPEDARRVKTEPLQAVADGSKNVKPAGLDEPVDPRSIGVGGTPYGLIAVIVLIVAALTVVAVKFIFGGSAGSGTTPIVAPLDAVASTDASAADTVDVAVAVDAGSVDARAATASPPTRRPPTRRPPTTTSRQRPR